jgi:hypothetical protein
VSVRGIRASVECDACGEPFHVDLDPAMEINGASLMDAAEQEIADDFALSSVQDGLHLCQKCTKVADRIGPEDHQPTRDEILEAVGALL